MTFVGLSLGHPDDRTAEHWLRDHLSVGILWACTHLVRPPYPHVALSFETSDGVNVPETPEELRAAAEEAEAARTARRSGRAVIYPGVDRLIGTLTVGQLVAVSAIERVQVLGGSPPAADASVDTRDFVRPQWIDGALTLVAMPAAGGRLVPFEVADPTPCCADH